MDKVTIFFHLYYPEVTTNKRMLSILIILQYYSPLNCDYNKEIRARL